MSLKVYNTQSRNKEDFKPHTEGIVKMYCCGPTVYGLLHVGNFRGAIFYNLVRLWLEELGYKVTFVYNYTDVDDKIIDKAKAEGKEAQAVAEFYIKEFEADIKRLGLKKHEHNPRVTEHMPGIIEMISKLIENKKAYNANGEVLYSIRSFDGYGKLSGRNPDDLRAGERVEIDTKKQDPLDFALWKPAKPGEPSWPSVWGAGRPGWHIECSAMAKSILGDQIDIHGGGMDLVFPHHENEIAQSEGCSGKPYVKYWLHNNMLNFSGAKMSKSAGNIKSAREFMDENNAEIYKYMLLSVHYRSICEFGEQGIDFTIKNLARIYSALSVAESILQENSKSAAPMKPEIDPKFDQMINTSWQGIATALNDDFNTPEALARIFEVIRVFNSQLKKGMKITPAVVAKAQSFQYLVLRLGKLMSLFQEPPTAFLTTLDDMLLTKMNIQRSDVDAVIKDRVQARIDKDFKKSDELRDKLTAMGISVNDTPQGATWEVTK